MDFRRLHPEPATVDSADLLGNLRLHERAHDERPWTITNFATTADGRATIDGRSGPIGDDGDLGLPPPAHAGRRAARRYAHAARRGYGGR